MGKIINGGWYSSQDQMPQPVSFLVGQNSTNNSEGSSQSHEANTQGRNLAGTSAKVRCITESEDDGNRAAGTFLGISSRLPRDFPEAPKT